MKKIIALFLLISTSAFAGSLTSVPGGTNGQLQYNNSGAFGGLTIGTGLTNSGGVLSTTGGGSGTVSVGTAGQYAYYSSTGSTVVGTSFLNVSNSFGTLPVANGGTGSTVGNLYGTYGEPVVNASALHTYGDSITQGYLVTSTTDYPYYLSQEMGATVTNYGTGGDMACDMVFRVWNGENPSNTYTTSNNVTTMMIGTNDSELKGVGAYETNYNNCVNSSMTWAAIPSQYKVLGSAMTLTGTWTQGSGSGGLPSQGEYTSTNGSTATATITTYGGPLYIWYNVADNWTGGQFTYSIDGGSSTTVSSATTTPISTHNGSVGGIFLIRVTGLAAGSHTVLFTNTASSGSPQYTMIDGVGTPPPLSAWGGPMVFNAGVIKECGDGNSAATTQYNSDAQSDVNLLSGDGLKVYFANTRDYIPPTQAYFGDTCSTPGLHPNAAGHQLITEGLAASMQFTPYAAALAFPLNLTGTDSTNTGFSIQNITSTGYSGVRHISNADTWWTAVGNTGVSVANLQNSWFVFDATTGYTNLLINSSGNVGIGHTAQYSGCNIGTSASLGVCGTTITTGSVSVGTTTLVNKLDVYGNEAIGTGYAGLKSAPTNGMIVQGNVSIGTSLNSYPLQVIGTASATTFAGSGASLTSLGTSNLTSVTGTANSTTYLRGDNTWASPSGSGTVNSGTQYQLGYYANTGTAMSGNSSINTNASGSLGIGTATPQVSLDVSAKTDALAFPVGTSSTRPATPLAGQTRYNNTANTKGFLETWQTLGTAAWAALQPLVGGGLETTNTGAVNATNLQNQVNSMITLGTSSLASTFGVAGIQIPRGTYPVSSGIKTEPWIKIQTSGTVKLDYSGIAIGTAATNATTATSSAVLNFASTPASAIAGAIVTDTTHPTYLPANTMIVSTTGTTATMSNNPTTTIASGDVMSFSPIGMNVTNDTIVTGDSNTFNVANLSPFINANDGSMLMNGPGYSSNTIGMMLGSGSTSPGTDANVRELAVNGLSIQNFGTCLRLKPDSLYILKFINGGDIANCGHGIDTATYPGSNVNSGENMSFKNWVIGNNTVGMYFDTTNIDTTCDGCSIDNNTTGIQSTVNDGYAKHAFINSHLENNSPIVVGTSATTYALDYILHDDKIVYTGSGPSVLFTGNYNLDMDGVYMSYANISNSPTNLFMAASSVTALRMSHIYWQAYTQAQLTSPNLLVTDDSCFAQGTNGNDLTSSPMPTYSTAVTNTGAGANTGITATVSNSVVWTTGNCSTSKSIKFAETNTTNSYTVVGDRIPVTPGDQLAMDVVFQTNTASSNALLQTEYVWMPCNPSITPTAEGFYGDTLKNDGTNNVWLKMNYVNVAVAPAGTCYAEPVINIGGMAASEVVYVGFIGVTKE